MLANPAIIPMYTKSGNLHEGKSTMELGLIATFVFVIVVFVVLYSTVKIVPQGQEWTVERFGRYTKTLRPGQGGPKTVLDPGLFRVDRFRR